MNHKKYIAIETLISSMINGAFSFVFAYLAFHKVGYVSSNQVLIDAIPQSLFVAFFAVFIPTLITRHRLRKGAISPLSYHSHNWPDHALLRALTAGIFIAILSAGLHFIVLKVLATDTFEFQNLLAFKVVYGVVLSILITPKALLLALSEFKTSQYV